MKESRCCCFCCCFYCLCVRHDKLRRCFVLPYVLRHKFKKIKIIQRTPSVSCVEAEWRRFFIPVSRKKGFEEILNLKSMKPFGKLDKGKMIEGWNKKVLLKDKEAVTAEGWKISYSSTFRSELERKAIKFMPFQEWKQMFSNSFTFGTKNIGGGCNFSATNKIIKVTLDLRSFKNQTFNDIAKIF